MPYITEEERQELDDCIDQMIKRISKIHMQINNPNDFSNFLGRINYCFTRIIMGVMKKTSYKNIAMITGVLENIKQEFYRRVASKYEEQKIRENGDIRPYNS